MNGQSRQQARPLIARRIRDAGGEWNEVGLRSFKLSESRNGQGKRNGQKTLRLRRYGQAYPAWIRSVTSRPATPVFTYLAAKQGNPESTHHTTKSPTNYRHSRHRHPGDSTQLPGPAVARRRPRRCAAAAQRRHPRPPPCRRHLHPCPCPCRTCPAD